MDAIQINDALNEIVCFIIVMYIIYVLVGTVIFRQIKYGSTKAKRKVTFKTIVAITTGMGLYVVFCLARFWSYGEIQYLFASGRDWYHLPEHHEVGLHLFGAYMVTLMTSIACWIQLVICGPPKVSDEMDVEMGMLFEDEANEKTSLIGNGYRYETMKPLVHKRVEELRLSWE